MHSPRGPHVGVELSRSHMGREPDGLGELPAKSPTKSVPYTQITERTPNETTRRLQSRQVYYLRSNGSSLTEGTFAWYTGKWLSVSYFRFHMMCVCECLVLGVIVCVLVPPRSPGARRTDNAIPTTLLDQASWATPSPDDSDGPFLRRSTRPR